MKNWFEKLPFALVRIGKKNRWLKYPIVLFLSIMVVVCEICDAVKSLARPKTRRRILASLLVFCMVFSLMPTTAFAAKPTRGVSTLCEHHTGHTPECGYTEGLEGTPCGFTSDAPEEASPSDAPEPETEPAAHVHDEDCGYLKAVEGIPCGFVCDVCNQEPEQKDCICPPVDSGEVTHGDGCPLYEAPEKPEQKECSCPPVDSGEVTHGEGCPLYEKLVAEQSEAVKNVLALIDALPTMDELAEQDTEGEGFAAYLAKLRLDTAAARTAYDALSDEEKAELDAAALEKLTELEEVLAAMPVLMSDAIPTLSADANNSYQNVKYTLTAGSPNGTATISGVVSKTAVTGINNVLTIPAQVQKNSTTYNVIKINPRAFYECSLLASVTVPSCVATIGTNAFTNMKFGAVVTLEHTSTLPTSINKDSFIAASEFPLYVVIADNAVQKALGDKTLSTSDCQGMIVSKAPVDPSFIKTNSGKTLGVRPPGTRLADGKYDVIGLRNGSSKIATTYSDGGYDSFLCIGENNPSQGKSRRLQLPSAGVESYVYKGVWAKADTEFIAGGKYLRVTYTLRNSTSSIITDASLGVTADVKIGLDDAASIHPTSTGFRMVNTKSVDQDAKGSGMQFTLNCKDATGADNVDTMWYGVPNSAQDMLFTDLPNKIDFTGQDSAIALSWKNMTIPANGEITKSVVFGVGEAAAPPALPTAPDSKPIALYLTTSGQKDITVNANVTDTTGVTDTLYYTINDGEEKTLGETVTADGTQKTIAGVIGAENFTANGTYTVKLWIMNSKGAMSEVITKVLTVTGGVMGGAGLEVVEAPVSPGGGYTHC